MIKYKKRFSEKLPFNRLNENSYGYIKKIETVSTGGNTKNDIITLKDNTVLIISYDTLYFYKSLKDYINNELPKETLDLY
ncbi:MAG: hypothetical protein WC554_10570 [Clostridia bacterium]